jgi:hypothetical protein
MKRILGEPFIHKDRDGLCAGAFIVIRLRQWTSTFYRNYHTWRFAQDAVRKGTERG